MYLRIPNFKNIRGLLSRKPSAVTGDTEEQVRVKAQSFSKGLNEPTGWGV